VRPGGAAATAVGDDHHHRVRCRLLTADVDAAAIGAVDRVADEVAQHTAEQHWIRDDDRPGIVRGQGQPARIGERAELPDYRCHDIGQPHVHRHRVQGAGVEARDFEPRSETMDASMVRASLRPNITSISW
jgi:hypothetical protein